MLPIRHSNIFRSRWWALLWAGGILWFAYDFAGGASDGSQLNQAASTDATGAPVTNEDAKQLAEAINKL